MLKIQMRDNENLKQKVTRKAFVKTDLSSSCASLSAYKQTMGNALSKDLGGKSLTKDLVKDLMKFLDEIYLWICKRG